MYVMEIRLSFHVRVDMDCSYVRVSFSSCSTVTM